MIFYDIFLGQIPSTAVASSRQQVASQWYVDSKIQNGVVLTAAVTLTFFPFVFKRSLKFITFLFFLFVSSCRFILHVNYQDRIAVDEINIDGRTQW